MAKPKTDRATPIVLSGIVAAPGFAAGPLHCELAASAEAAVATPSDPQAERDRLRLALAAASQSLAQLLESLENDSDAAGMIEFQVAMLEDESLSEPAFAAIDEGRPALAAWQASLGEVVADYQASDDAYFQARASDIADIRDRVVMALKGGDALGIPPDAIYLGEDLPPSRFLETKWGGGGVALSAGSVNSHVAMLARARGVPMLVGLGRPGNHPIGAAALLDGEAASLTLDPGEGQRAEFAERRATALAQAEREATFLGRPAVTADGEPVSVLVNLAGPADLEACTPDHCDGVGLVRTEFLFQAGRPLPGEEAQLSEYQRILRWAKGKPVTFRTLDAGGDKPIPGYTLPDESNPFLGHRGLRLSLARPEIFKIQLRALLRAAKDGTVKIMLPMVTDPHELAAARDLLEEARGGLRRAGVDHGDVTLGIMVEVPATAIAIETFDADFFSIGSNDLVQYVTACGRDVSGLEQLARADAPAVLRLIEQVAKHAASRGCEASICGDVAGDPKILPKLLEAGLRTLSVAPSALAATKAAIAAYRKGIDNG